MGVGPSSAPMTGKTAQGSGTEIHPYATVKDVTA